MSNLDYHRGEVVRIARMWIGTPYRHQASLLGVGCDCLGLVRGIWRAIHGREAERVPGYSRDWGEADGSEPLMRAAERHLIEAAVHEVGPGRVLLFRYRPDAAAKHLAVQATPTTMIHAADGAPVAEVSLGTWWRRRIVSVYDFPTSR